MPPASVMPEQTIHTRLFPTLCSEASHSALNPWWWEYLHDGNWQMAYMGLFSQELVVKQLLVCHRPSQLIPPKR